MQLASLAAQADSLCFRSLPSKVQQQLFSEDEQARLGQFPSRPESGSGHWFDREPAFVPWSLGRKASAYSLPSQASSTLYLDTDSESDSDSEIESVPEKNEGNMDQSMRDSFRCLDEDSPLDLTLDDYHAHLSASAPKFPARKPSFRRTISLNSVHRRKPSTSSTSAVHRRLPTWNRSHAPSPLANVTSRPPSRQPSVHHASRSSTSSIDPAAQYYHDPEARLKLRVYLASPQKFDEAIQFGFPAVENKENQPPESTPEPEVEPEPEEQEVQVMLEPEVQTKAPGFLGTFLEEDDRSLFGDGDGDGHGDEEKHEVDVSDFWSKDPVRPTPLHNDWPSLMSSSQIEQQLAGGMGGGSGNGREMTLKMTLTRPDLRTEASTPSSTDSFRSDLLGNSSLGSLEPDPDDRGVVKKMWRKVWRSRF